MSKPYNLNMKNHNKYSTYPRNLDSDFKPIFKKIPSLEAFLLTT